MNISIADFMVHVDRELLSDRMRELEDSIRADQCVLSACVSKRDPHLMLVAYDPDCTSAAHILGHFSEQGVHAEGVGL